ncbi:MAG: hypothetical protein HY673_12525 [Chloroflexi bacterium]|nr:hypothetical protein [Chloroflexota bacterium]
MDRYDLIDLALAAAVTLVSIDVFARFLRWRARYHLGVLIVSVALAICFAVLVLAPTGFARAERALWERLPVEVGIRKAVRTSAYVLVGVLVLSYIYQADIKRLFARAKEKPRRQATRRKG